MISEINVRHVLHENWTNYRNDPNMCYGTKIVKLGCYIETMSYEHLIEC